MDTNMKLPEFDLTKYDDDLNKRNEEINRYEEEVCQRLIATYKNSGWTPAPRLKGETPAVWVHHETGNWGLLVSERKRPDDHIIHANIVRKPDHFLNTLHHLSSKPWFTMRHVKQMISLYSRLHPEEGILHDEPDVGG